MDDATTGTPLPPANITGPTDYHAALASRSYDAHDDQELVMRQYLEREAAVKAQLHPTIWQAVIGLVEQRDTIAHHRTDTMMAELMRHLPGIAPAIQVVWEHVQTTNPENVGWCCAGEGCMDPNDGN